MNKICEVSWFVNYMSNICFMVFVFETLIQLQISADTKGFLYQYLMFTVHL